MDNSATFHSSLLKELFDSWKINTYFRVAQRASGNGIIERNHRTIKTIAERSDISPQEAVFWYNLAPRSYDQQIIPHQQLFNYEWRNPLMDSGEDKGRARRAQQDQFFYLKLFFSVPIMDEKMPIL